MVREAGVDMITLGNTCNQALDTSLLTDFLSPRVRRLGWDC